MGFWGYNQKDYEKNTESFKTKLAEIAECSDPNTRRLCKEIDTFLDVYFCGDKKKMKNIDKTIGMVLDKMLIDARHNKKGSVFEWTLQLFDLVNNRNHCEITYTKESLERRNEMANFLEGIAEVFQMRNRIIDRRYQIVVDSEPYAQDSAEYKKFSDEFDELEDWLENFKQTVSEYQKGYNTAAEALRGIDPKATVIYIDENYDRNLQITSRLVSDAVYKQTRHRGYYPGFELPEEFKDKLCIK